MTQEEILAALEGLKDLTNDAGRRSIDAIKTGVLGLPTIEPLLPLEETIEVSEEKVEVSSEPHVKRAYHRKK